MLLIVGREEMEESQEAEILKQTGEIWRKINWPKSAPKLVECGLVEKRRERSFCLLKFTLCFLGKEIRGNAKIEAKEEGRVYVSAWFEDGTSFHFRLS